MEMHNSANAGVPVPEITPNRIQTYVLISSMKMVSLPTMQNKKVAKQEYKMQIHSLTETTYFREICKWGYDAHRYGMWGVIGWQV